MWTTSSFIDDHHIGSAAVALNNKIFFAGGTGVNLPYSTKVEIYDTRANAWSSYSLNESKYFLTGAVAGNKVYWAGGYGSGGYLSCSVEVMDANTGSLATQFLSGPAGFGKSFGYQAVVKDNKIIFYSGSETYKVDIYDPATGVWSVGVLLINEVQSDKVFKLEF